MSNLAKGTFHQHGSVDSFSLPVFKSIGSCIVRVGLMISIVSERGTWDDVREEAANLADVRDWFHGRTFWGP